MKISVNCPRRAELLPIRKAVMRRTLLAMCRFSPRVSRLTIVLRDEERAGGEEVKTCRLVAVLTEGPQLVIDAEAESFEEASAQAADRMARLIARTLPRLHRNAGDLRMPFSNPLS